MREKLDCISVPFYTALHGDKCCSDEVHKRLIESYYNDIVNAVMFADSFLPKTVPGVQKSYWTSTLTDLKQKSIDCCKFWRANGSPKNGPIYACKVDCTYKYKKAITRFFFL